MLLASLTFADTAIDTQIDAIINATDTERPTLVNDFKTSVATLNDEERSAAIAQLRDAMQANNLQTKTQTQTRTQTKARINQTQEAQNMEQAQRMQQHQAASQAMNQAGGATGTPMQNRFMGNK